MARRALLSVYDKTGVVEFAQGLVALGFEIVSTGGTFQALQDAGVPVTYISDVTSFPEILDGRVKTLHPRIHGGILARRDIPAHMEQLASEDIAPIDVVAVNLYPFAATISRPGVALEEALENIDIGGPAMVRAAAKNHPHVVVVVNPERYGAVLTGLRQGTLDAAQRMALAQEAFAHTAAYDQTIQAYLADLLADGVTQRDGAGDLPERITLSFTKVQPMRYGENPHQTAAFYREDNRLGEATLAEAKQLHGKELSFNNIYDTSAAIEMARSFSAPAVVAVKHTNPCGLALGKDTLEAYQKAYAADPVSIFGGIVACNRLVDAAAAEAMSQTFLEVIVAPEFTPEALAILTRKPSLRLLQMPMQPLSPWWDMKRVPGGLLVQEADLVDLDETKLQVVTKRAPTDAEWADLRFAWTVVKHVKSNAIVLARDQVTVGVGAGQMSRILSAEIAIEQAGEKAVGSAMGSDAFFPFDDVVTTAAAAGVTSIIQPGGSKRDADSIAAADKAGMAMVFTGIRHFKH
ncbi:MAG: bifunctional phosphoribosylaminoimidazolecarboxamide formyltransferase/IMP cyclohydrolase [Limnochordia bacterium]